MRIDDYALRRTVAGYTLAYTNHSLKTTAGVIAGLKLLRNWQGVSSMVDTFTAEHLGSTINGTCWLPNPAIPESSPHHTALTDMLATAGAHDSVADAHVFDIFFVKEPATYTAEEMYLLLMGEAYVLAGLTFTTWDRITARLTKRDILARNQSQAMLSLMYALQNTHCIDDVAALALSMHTQNIDSETYKHAEVWTKDNITTLRVLAQVQPNTL